MIQHVNVQLALFGQSGESQIAAADEPDARMVRIVAMTEIKLGVELVAQEKFDDDFARLDLFAQPAQRRFVLIGRRAEGQLLAEPFRRAPAQTNHRGVVYVVAAGMG